MRNAKVNFHRKWKRLFEAAKRDSRQGNENSMANLRECMLSSFREDTNQWSLREMFTEYVDGGYELVRDMGASTPASRLHEAADAVNTSMFANIVGQFAYTMALEGFRSPEFVMDQVVDTVDTVFDGERIPGIGRLGDDVAEVPEGRPFPRAVVGEEFVETPPTIKRGMIVEVTREAIFFDRTGQLIQNASDVGRAIAFNKEKRILDTVLGIVTSYRRNGGAPAATYTSVNTKTSNALVDWTSLDAAERHMDAVVDPTSGELIPFASLQLLYPKALHGTVMRILSATEVRHSTQSAAVQTLSPSPIAGPQPITGPYVKQRGASDSTWFMGDFKRAFKYMQNWGPTILEEGANTEVGFDRDIVARYRISERGVPAVIEPLLVVKNTA